MSRNDALNSALVRELAEVSRDIDSKRTEAIFARILNGKVSKLICHLAAKAIKDQPRCIGTPNFISGHVFEQVFSRPTTCSVYNLLLAETNPADCLMSFALIAATSLKRGNTARQILEMGSGIQLHALSMSIAARLACKLQQWDIVKSTIKALTEVHYEMFPFALVFEGAWHAGQSDIVNLLYESSDYASRVFEKISLDQLLGLCTGVNNDGVPSAMGTVHSVFSARNSSANIGESLPVLEFISDWNILCQKLNYKGISFKSASGSCFGRTHVVCDDDQLKTFLWVLLHRVSQEPLSETARCLSLLQGFYHSPKSWHNSTQELQKSIAKFRNRGFDWGFCGRVRIFSMAGDVHENRKAAETSIKYTVSAV